jgi:DNA repair exonuclease SbcCD nuclease subunit
MKNIGFRVPLSMLVIYGAVGFIPALPAFADIKQDIRKAYVDGNVKGSIRSQHSALALFTRIFDEFDKDGNGLGQTDIDNFKVVESARRRASNAERILRLDLDGDMRVTRQEVEAEIKTEMSRSFNLIPKNEEQKKDLERRFSSGVSQLMSSDKNGNGQIENLEFYEPINGIRRDEDIEEATAFAQLMVAADPNGDGTLTQVEAGLLIAQTLEGADEEIDKLRAAKE